MKPREVGKDRTAIPLKVFFDRFLSVHLSRGWDRASLVSGRVKTVSSGEFVIEANLADTIAQLKTKVACYLEVNEEKLILSWGSTRLQESMTVRQARLNPCATIVAELTGNIEEENCLCSKSPQVFQDGTVARRRENSSLVIEEVAVPCNSSNAQTRHEKSGDERRLPMMLDAMDRTVDRKKVLRAAITRMSRKV